MKAQERENTTEIYKRYVHFHPDCVSLLTFPSNINVWWALSNFLLFCSLVCHCQRIFNIYVWATTTCIRYRVNLWDLCIDSVTWICGLTTSATFQKMHSLAMEIQSLSSTCRRMSKFYSMFHGRAERTEQNNNKDKLLLDFRQQTTFVENSWNWPFMCSLWKAPFV